jgi:uncharacterized OB-fold protein
VTRRPVREDLIHDAGNGGDSYLIGSRCPICALVMFPRFWICPRCLDRDRPPDALRLSGRATLDRYCVAQRGPRAFHPPYIQSYVKLEEGPVIYSLVTGVDPHAPDLRPAEPMEVRVAVVREDDDGNEVIGWLAEPTRDGRG